MSAITQSVANLPTLEDMLSIQNNLESINPVKTQSVFAELPNQLIMRIIRESTQIKNAEALAEHKIQFQPILEEFNQKVQEFIDFLDEEWAYAYDWGSAIPRDHQLPEWFDFTYGFYSHFESLEDGELEFRTGSGEGSDLSLTTCFIAEAFLPMEYR
jgi:hypothetical protein